MRACSRCVYDDTRSNIIFNSQELCNYYNDFDKFFAEYPMEDAEWKKFQEIAAQVEKAVRYKKFDCSIGISGGCDSSNLVILGKEKLGFHPLVVHFENTWFQRLFISDTVNTRQEK